MAVLARDAHSSVEREPVIITVRGDQEGKRKHVRLLRIVVTRENTQISAGDCHQT